MDAHGLLLELTEEREALVNKEYTHLGIGFASDGIRVLIVEILSTKFYAIDRLQQSEDGGVEVAGRILNPNVGIFAARICLLSNPKKQVAEVTGEHMTVSAHPG